MFNRHLQAQAKTIVTLSEDISRHKIQRHDRLTGGAVICSPTGDVPPKKGRSEDFCGAIETSQGVRLDERL
jgi:hypothetical protein